MSATIYQAEIFEDATATFLARVKIDASNTLTNIQQSDLSSITYAVFLDDTSVGTGTLTVSSVVYNTLQTGTIWTKDSTGFNFKAVLSSSLFASAGPHTVEFKFTLTGGTVFWLVWNVLVKRVLTS